MLVCVHVVCSDSRDWFMDGNYLIVIVTICIILPLATMKHLGTSLLLSHRCFDENLSQSVFQTGPEHSIGLKFQFVGRAGELININKQFINLN